MRCRMESDLQKKGVLRVQLEEYIQQLFDSKNASINGVSNLTGINKGSLHRMLSGSQKIKFEQLMKISDALTLSYGEQEALFNHYFEEMYGSRTMDSVRLAVAEFSGAFSNASDRIPEKGYDKYPADGFMPNMQSVEEAIVTTTDIESGKIYTNFSFENKRLDDFFFKKAESGKIELIHFVEKIQNNGELSNLHSLIRSLRFMNIGQFPYMQNLWQTGSDWQILPYFVITEKALILFNDSYGFISTEPRAVKKVLDTVQNMAASAKRLGQKPTNIMEIRNLVAGASVSGCGMTSFCRYPCFSAHITKEMMYTAANDVPNKDMLIDLCVTHYKTLLGGTSQVQFVTTEGMEDFARTGNFYEIPPEFVHGFPPEVRVEILEKTKADIENGSLYILNPQLDIPDGINLCGFSDCSIISGSDTSQKDFGISMLFRYCAQDLFYIKLLQIVRDYLIAGRFVMSRDSALRVLESCISIARNSE